MLTLRNKKYTEQSVYISEPMTDDDVLDLAQLILEEADRIWREDPREWTNYDAYVGFLVGTSVAGHDMLSDQYNKLVALICLELDNLNKRDAA